MDNATRQNRTLAAAVAVAAVVVIGAFAMKLAGTGKDNMKTVCDLQATAQADILDTTKSNSRDDLVASIRKRASIMDESAGKTEGTVHDAFKTYAAALRDVATAIEKDKSGQQLNDLVSQLSDDPAVTRAGETISGIIDTECG